MYGMYDIEQHDMVGKCCEQKLVEEFHKTLTLTTELHKQSLERLGMPEMGVEPTTKGYLSFLLHSFPRWDSNPQPSD